MKTDNFITITEARRRIFELAEEVQKPDTQFILTEKGKPKAVLLSFDEYDSLIETIEVLQDFPDLYKDIQKVHKDYRTGRYKTYTTLDELLGQQAFIAADKGKKKYEVSNTSRTGRRKTAKKATKK